MTPQIIIRIFLLRSLSTIHSRDAVSCSRCKILQGIFKLGNCCSRSNFVVSVPKIYYLGIIADAEYAFMCRFVGPLIIPVSIVRQRECNWNSVFRDTRGEAEETLSNNFNRFTTYTGRISGFNVQLTEWRIAPVDPSSHLHARYNYHAPMLKRNGVYKSDELISVKLNY